MSLYIIKKCFKHHKHDEDVLNITEEDAGVIRMKAKEFNKYIDKYGYHFNKDLCHIAIESMVNADNSAHRFSCETMKDIVQFVDGKYGKCKCTLGDLTYLANMAYADFYPTVINTEDGCIQYALHVANDVDGYEGIVFMRWLADVIGKKLVNIDWAKYIK